MRIVLFLCSGNYYRSRFAEAFFNQRAAKLGLFWRAESGGLKPEDFVRNPGPVSRYVVEALRAREIAVVEPRGPLAVREADLARAHRIVAVKESEHRPLLVERFSPWADRVTYWNVHDIEDATPAETIADIEQRVEALLAELAAEG